MDKKGKLLKSKAQFSREELAGLLESIAARIRSGSLTFGEGAEAVAMALPTVFTVELLIEDYGTIELKRELELEIKWPIKPDGTPTETGGPASGFTVS